MSRTLRVYHAWQSAPRGPAWLTAGEFQSILMIGGNYTGDPFKDDPIAPFVAYALGQLDASHDDPATSTRAVQIDFGPGEDWQVCPPRPWVQVPTVQWYMRIAAIIQAVVRPIRAKWPKIELHWFWGVPGSRGEFEAGLVGFADGLKQLAAMNAFRGIDALALQFYACRVETRSPAAVAARPGYFAPVGSHARWAGAGCRQAIAALGPGSDVRIIGEVHHGGPFNGEPRDLVGAVPLEQLQTTAGAIVDVGADLCFWGSSAWTSPHDPTPDPFDDSAQHGWHESHVRPAMLAVKAATVTA